MKWSPRKQRQLFGDQKDTSAGMHIPFGFPANLRRPWPNVVMGLHKSGDLKILSLMGDKRSELIPKVPTAKEDGFNVKGTSTHFIILPNGVPKPVREKLYVLMEKVTQDPEFVKRLATLGTDVLFMDSEISTDFLKEWYETAGKLYKLLGMIKKK